MRANQIWNGQSTFFPRGQVHRKGLFPADSGTGNLRVAGGSLPRCRGKLHVKAMAARDSSELKSDTFFGFPAESCSTFSSLFAFALCARAFLPDTFSFVCPLQILSVFRVKVTPALLLPRFLHVIWTIRFNFKSIKSKFIKYLDASFVRHFRNDDADTKDCTMSRQHRIWNLRDQATIY